MKKVILMGLFVLSGMFAFAQNVTVSGTVSDQNGKPVPFAFISDSQHPYATFSDRNGRFTLMADPASNLLVTATTFPESRIAIDSHGDMKIVLAGTLPANIPVAKNVFKDKESSVDMTESSLTRIGSHQDTLHGSRFIFANWVHAYGITPKNLVKQNDGYLFNYDKMEGNLVFTSDGGNSVHDVLKDEIKGFILFDDNAQPYVFEDVQAINPKRYVEVLSSGNKYKIYKDLGTKFIKSNYTTNGISSSGNNYDEYADESIYYVVKLPDGQPQKISLRKKALKTVFAADADKVNKFLADNDTDIDDAYLKKLGDFMNQ
jgi:hypothetical protein